MNFELIDAEVDFYFVALSMFNNCTSELITGTVPISGSGKYTLVMFITFSGW